MIAIKFCGLTNLDDCHAAIAAGANWLGFNFHPPSPRSTTAVECRRIVSALCPALERLAYPVHLVGVFVDASPSEILETLDSCGLELAQLSGADAQEAIMSCQGRAYAVLRTGSSSLLWKQIYRLPQRLSPPAALIDAAAPGQFGGTGRVADWVQAASLAAEFPIFLAGGLTPSNVAAAVRSVRPWGVDVASGIEIAPGKKDAAKMESFVRAAREVFVTQEY